WRRLFGGGGRGGRVSLGGGGWGLIRSPPFRQSRANRGVRYALLKRQRLNGQFRVGRVDAPASFSSGGLPPSLPPDFPPPSQQAPALKLSDCSVDTRRAFDHRAGLAQEDVRRRVCRGQPAIFGFQFDAEQSTAVQNENVGQARLCADGLENRSLYCRSISA